MDEAKRISNTFLIACGLKLASAPIERYHLLRQTQDVLTLQSKERVSNIVNYVQKTYQFEGVKGFWRSNLTNIYMWFPQLFAKLAFFQNIKQSTAQKGDLFSNSLSAALCGVVGVTFAYPFDTVRVRQATDFGRKQFTTFGESYYQVKTDSGFFKGLFAGYSIGCLHVALQAILTNVIHDFVPADMEDYSWEVSYLAAQVVTYPLESVKHRLQVKSILFQQEAAKRANLIAKLQYNYNNLQLNWAFGGISAQVIRTAACFYALQQIGNQVKY